MPKIEFSDKEIRAYFEKGIKHIFYDVTVEKADSIAIHANGDYPKELIEERRPHEPHEVLEYRKKIYVPITKPTFDKVESSLTKIRRASDWSIKYENKDEFKSIADGETLEDYCEKSFPYFQSVTNWVFSVLLKNYLVDPNSVILVMPIETQIEVNEYLRPFPMIFNSWAVIDFVQEDYAVLENPLGSIFFENNVATGGKSIYIATTESIQRYDQTDSRGNYELMMDYKHGLEELPAFKIGAKISKADGNNFLYESRISPMQPELDEAAREYSDYQASIVIHVYPERFEFTSNECNACQGTGQMPNTSWTPGCGDPSIYPCNAPGCQGGYIVPGPYTKTMIKLPDATSPVTNMPNPPIGYVQKDVEIVKLQAEGVAKHLFNALASVNMQFLEQVPLDESGISKGYDRDEANNFVHAVGEDLVRTMDTTYRFTAHIRYDLNFRNEIDEKMVPTITVPEKFDILSSTILEQELSSAKTSKANPIILSAMEIQYAKKKFNSDPEVADMVQLTLSLNPLPNISEDEKMSRLSNKGISREAYVISSNIDQFVRDAIEEDEGFTTKPRKEQQEVMNKKATELIKIIDKEKEEAKVLAIDGGGLGELQDGQQPQPPISAVK